MRKLLLATNNAGKVREYRLLLKGSPFEIVTPAEQGLALEVDETADTYEQNASLKAVAFAEAGGMLALADDSGLEVDALGGAPGPRAARFAGEGADDRQRVALLLSKVEGVPWEKRTARFVCVIALAAPGERPCLFRGECEGYISLEPHGGGGFGYDPVFYLPVFCRTMAELSMEEKNRVSHRAAAAREMLRALSAGAVG